MLAAVAKEAFTDPAWLYEIKSDGYCIVAHTEKGKAVLRGWELQDYTSKFQAIADELTSLPDCILDGEIVVFNDQRKPDFSALQNYGSSGGDIAYYVFDLLYLEDEAI